MNGLNRIVLTLKEKLAVPLEAGERLQPSLLNGLSTAQISAMPVLYGRQDRQIGDFFEVERKGGATDDLTGANFFEDASLQDEDLAAGILELHGDLSKVKGLGLQMQKGIIIVNGDAGMHLGAFMSGGCIIVRGSSASWTGAHLSGGSIFVLGNVEHFTGSAYWGCKAGMTGGIIVVHGSAGDMTARLMRRGLVIIRGNAGDFTCSEMIAGTVIVGKETGRRAGAQMKRGTLILSTPPQLLPTFRYNCLIKPTFMHILARALDDRRIAADFLHNNYLFLRYSGDTAVCGKGEIFIRCKE